VRAVVLTFDCLPLALLGCYGNSAGQTPHFDHFSARSVVFDQHFTCSVSPDALNRGWMSGCYPGFGRSETAVDPTIYFERLGQNSVATQLVCSQSVSPSSDEKSLFGKAVSVDCPADGLCNSEDILSAVKQAAGDLKSDSRGSSLLWISLAGIHEESARIDDSAALQIEKLDDRLGRIVHLIEEIFVDEKILFITTAGRGCVLGENRFRTESHFRLTEEVVHTPLLLSLRNCDAVSHDFPASSRRSFLAQPIDLMPTLFDWFEVSQDKQLFEGQSLIPIINGAVGTREYAVMENGPGESALRTPDFFLVTKMASDQLESEQNPPSLFIKPDDRWDVNDVSLQEPDVLDQLVQTLQEFRVAAGLDSPLIAPLLKSSQIKK